MAVITQLLARWRAGDRAAESELLNLIYPVLRNIAREQVQRNRGVLSLQATELANEAYSRLLDQRAEWESREHFFAVAAVVIRRVVIDYLRARGGPKRGGRLPFVPLHELTEGQSPCIDDAVDWLAVDEALNELAVVDGDCARIVELKFFSGLTTNEIADACGSSVATVGRQWRFARAWLGRRLTQP